MTNPDDQPIIPAGGSDPSGEKYIELDPAVLADQVKNGATAEPTRTSRSTGEQQPLTHSLADEMDPVVLARAVPRQSL